MNLNLIQIKCERCGHTWIPRQRIVTMCPACKSLLFDKKKLKIKKIEGDSK